MTASRFYLSFVDEARPEGQRFVGATVVNAKSFPEAVLVSHATKCNPGGQVLGHDIPDGVWPPTPAELDHKLLSDPAELERVMEAWTGAGVAQVGALELEGGD